MPEPPPPPPVATPVMSYGYLTPDELAARKRSTRLWVIAGSVLAIVLVGWFAQAMFHASREAGSLITELHGRMQQKDWDGIYNEANSAWKENESSEKARLLFSGIDRKLGKPLSTKQQGIKTEANTGGRYVSASFISRFEQDAEVEESITWKYEEGKFRLLRYHIASEKFLNP